MTFRVYMMPMTGDGLTIQTAKRCKYFSLMTSYSTLTYGPEPVCLVGSDTTTEQHDVLIANTDVRAFPENLDNTITNAQRLNVVAYLDTMNIPSGWISNGMSFRTILRRMFGMFQILQGVDGRGFRFLQRNLDDTISQLPNNVVTAMQLVASDLGLSTTGINGSTTLRAVLINFGNQLANRSIIIKGRTI